MNVVHILVTSFIFLFATISTIDGFHELVDQPSTSKLIPKDEKKPFLAYGNNAIIEKLPESPIGNHSDLVTLQNNEIMYITSGLGFDWDSKTIFYTLYQRASISSAFFNNTNHRLLTATPNKNLKTYAIYFDPLDFHLYGAIYNEYTIVKLNPYLNDPLLYPIEPQVVYSGSSLDKIKSIAIDHCESTIYFTNGNQRGANIQKVSKNGNNLETIIDTDISHPRGLTIDHRKKLLYWGDRNLGKIEETDFDGKNRKVFKIGASTNFFDIAISPTHIYWTNREAGYLYRMERDGAGNDSFVFAKRDEDSSPRGIIYVDKPLRSNECDRKPNLVTLNQNINTIQTWQLGEPGMNKSLECMYKTGRSTQVKWIHNEKEINGSSELVNSTLSRSFIHFDKTKESGGGKYSCIVSNEFETEILNFTIKICSTCIPKIDKSEDKIIFIRGSKDRIMTCKFTTIVKSSVRWSRDGNETVMLTVTSFQNSDGMTSESVIKFPQVEDSISGKYSCTVSNDFGSDTFEFHVLVQDEEPGSGNQVAYGIGGAAVVILVCSVVVVTLLWKKYKSQKELVRKLTAGEIEEFFQGNPNLVGNELNSCGPNTTALSLPFDSKNEILIDDLQILKNVILGQGEFGLVYRGDLRGEPVAVKTLKQKVQLEYVKAILSELKIMAYIGEHKNIVKFLGAQTTKLHENIVNVVVEFSPLGDLHSYLQKNRCNFGGNFKGTSGYENFDEKKVKDDFMRIASNWSKQIADGMDYLSTVKNVVHSDLATRNVLIFPHNLVKISDFGLSRQLYNYTKYIKKSKSPLPFRWLALESLRFKEFTSKSDIWAYGITMWEIFTLGETPFPEFSFTKEFIDKIIEGMRPPKPVHTTEQIYAEMTKCWDPDPLQRPSFAHFVLFFQNMLVDKWASRKQPAAGLLKASS